MEAKKVRLMLFAKTDLNPKGDGLVHEEIANVVPSKGDMVYYRYDKQTFAKRVKNVIWDFDENNPYTRVRLDLV